MSDMGSFPPPSFPPPSGPPSAGEPAADGAGPVWWKRWWAIAGAIVLVVVGVGAVATLAGGDDDSASTGTETLVTTGATTTAATSPTDTNPSTTAATPATQAPTTTDTPATTNAPATSEAPETTVVEVTDPRCGYRGVDDFGDMQVEVEFANPLGPVPAVEISFALLDGAGTRFHTDSGSFDLPQVAEVIRAEVDTITELPADVDGADVACEVLEIDEGFGFDDVQPPPDSSACEVDGIDDFGDIQITLATTSPFDSTENLRIHYALRGDGGARFADSSTSVELVAPGESVRVSEDTVTEPADWVTPDEISCEILGVRASEF